jgi:TfoX/Sxy family transcriptional regulator of competence genes
LATIEAGRFHVAADQDHLVSRVRAGLAGAGALREVKMFGGVGFMLNGNMVAAASKRGVLLRIGKDRYGEALTRPGTRPMDMRGRPMEGYLYVDPAVVDDAALRDWLSLATAFVKTLPPKTANAKPKRTRRL